MKKFFFPLCMFALALGSCAKDDVTDGVSAPINESDLLSLNVYSGTTRGTDMTTAAMEGTAANPGEVLLRIDDDGVPEFSCTFVYNDGKSDWEQEAADKLKWESITFPANFYSLHDGVPIDVKFGANSASKSGYTVDGLVSTDHKDLVFYASRLNAIPTGGTLSAHHKHALSKLHIYTATGGNRAFIAKVNLVNINGQGDVTITPLSVADQATKTGVSWSNLASRKSYNYLSLSKLYPDVLQVNGDNSVIINSDDDAPMMIIPQTTTAATIETDPNGLDAFVNKDMVEKDGGSYVEVIYYMTDSEGERLVGYEKVSDMPDAADYCAEDQDKTLYVKAGFPLGHEFLPNKEYDITLGMGSDGSSGGKLLADYYVDKDGNPVSLTKNGVVTKPEIPEIDEGDDVLGDGNDAIDIIVVAPHHWDDGIDASSK